MKSREVLGIGRGRLWTFVVSCSLEIIRGRLG